MSSSIFDHRWVTVFASALDHLEAVIWPTQAAPDATTAAFYVYKPYPSSVKANQIDDWVALQARALSPFANSHTYVYKARSGLALWASPTPFSGVPETALQPTMPDGEYWSKGQRFSYRQVWLQGEMRVCEWVDGYIGDVPWHNLSIADQRAWARPRQIDAWLRKPVTWAGMLMAVALVVCCWYSGAWLGLSWQGGQLQRQSNALEQQLGDKLALQQRMQQAQQLIALSDEWRWQQGWLPQTLAAVISEVLSQTSWQSNSIAWQSDTLTVELVASNLDIAALVQQLEQTGIFARVAIRPHTAQDTWVLEVEPRVP